MKAQLTAIVRPLPRRFCGQLRRVPGTEVVSATGREALETLIEDLSIVLEVNRDVAIKEAGQRANQCQIVVDLNGLDEEGVLELGEENHLQLDF